MYDWQVNHLKTIHLTDSLKNIPLPFPDMVLALGYFDGVHRAHKKLLETARNIAEDKNIAFGVMTFHPHPKVVLSDTLSVETFRYITPVEEKKEQMKNLGVDYLFIVSFDKAFAAISPEAFVEEYIINLGVKHVVAGFDYTYGFRGEGNMETFPAHAKGKVSHTVIHKISEQGEKIGSSQIREGIEKGDMAAVRRLLGRPYRIRGTVVHGEKRGRTIGYPTANIQVSEPYLLPRTGVYAVTLFVQGTWYEGVCNVGYKPTFHENGIETPVIEVHVFDFDENIYGEKVIVDWHRFIRPEQKFSSVEMLIAQMNEDADVAKQFFRKS